MTAIKVEPGRERGPRDDSRRFLPVSFHFDTRAAMLNEDIDEAWDPAIKEQSRQNQASTRAGPIHEFGADSYEDKIRDFAALGAAPWSVVALHNVYLAQVRSAFACGDYYPALLGACGLGERILNQLVLTLRDDYQDHAATAAVADKNSFDNWKVCIGALRGWDIFSEAVARDFTGLMKRRHAAVHYRSELDSGDARGAALEAVLLLSQLIEELFAPIGQRAYYFAGPIGRSYVCVASESDPFVRRFILPACVLVSPVFRFVPAAGGFDIYDDADYGVDEPPLTDEQFAHPSRATPQVEYPF